MLKEISGGVCAAKGFRAAGIHCGVKAGSSPDKNDLALILSEKDQHHPQLKDAEINFSYQG